MRVGLVTDFYYPWVGGPSRLLATLAEGLTARGHDIFLLAPSPVGSPAVENNRAFEVERVRSIPVPFGYELRATVFPVATASRWIRRIRPDVVHIHHPFPLSAAALTASKRAGVPVVATNHTIPACSLWGLRRVGPVYGPASACLGWWIVRLMNSCDAVATPTATAAGLLQDIGFKGTARVISNGIDVHRFSPADPDDSLRARFGLDNRPVVLYTGRLDAEKEMDVWLRAAALVTREVDAQFLVGGKGAERSALEALTRDLGIEDRVAFIGYVTEDELPRVYRLAAAYCITSPVELQSISTLEALASGLPAVGVRAGALPELIRDGWNGFLAEPGDPQEIAAGLVRLLQDGQFRETAARRSREMSMGHKLETTVAAYEAFLGVAAAGESRTKLLTAQGPGGTAGRADAQVRAVSTAVEGE